MKKFIVVLISILLLILDISFLPFLAIKGIYPSICICNSLFYYKWKRGRSIYWSSKWNTSRYIFYSSLWNKCLSKYAYMLCSRHYRRKYMEKSQNNSCYYYVFFNHYKAYSGIFNYSYYRNKSKFI